VIEIVVSQSSAFDRFDCIVDAFGESVGPASKEVIEDLFEPVFKIE
jgi:hypothetical protein